MVSQILEDSLHQSQILKQQDIIIEIDGQKFSSSSNLRNIIASSRPNESKKIKVLRDGKEKNVTVKLGERPNETKSIFRYL